MDSHRILILYITEKSGHHHAAMALEKTLHSIDKTLEVYTIDAFDYTNPILNKIAHNTYMHVIKRR
ncbi:MAG: hypothetical protein PHQ54_02250, partial [Candidatus Omnitrophica bacterium]|nr:hypothetical protein [Candidatus Omnitrophota bacterium]